jgi:hypothetical protein
MTEWLTNKWVILYLIAAFLLIAGEETYRRWGKDE